METLVQTANVQLANVWKSFVEGKGVVRTRSISERRGHQGRERPNKTKQQDQKKDTLSSNFNVYRVFATITV